RRGRRLHHVRLPHARRRRDDALRPLQPGRRQDAEDQAAMMKTFALLVLAASVAHAGPDGKPKAAPATDKLAKAAGEAFAAAHAADGKGDLATALGLYSKAYEISPHPSTAYNIGDVARRLNKLGQAIKFYETYLALAPTAADRKDVEALIDKLMR